MDAWASLQRKKGINEGPWLCRPWSLVIIQRSLRQQIQRIRRHGNSMSLDNSNGYLSSVAYNIKSGKPRQDKGTSGTNLISAPDSLPLWTLNSAEAYSVARVRKYPTQRTPNVNVHCTYDAPLRWRRSHLSFLYSFWNEDSVCCSYTVTIPLSIAQPNESNSMPWAHPLGVRICRALCLVRHFEVAYNMFHL